MKNRSLQFLRRNWIALVILGAILIIIEVLTLIVWHQFNPYGIAPEGWWWSEETFSRIVFTHFAALAIVGAVVLAVGVLSLIYPLFRRIARKTYRPMLKQYLKRVPSH